MLLDAGGSLATRLCCHWKLNSKEQVYSNILLLSTLYHALLSTAAPSAANRSVNDCNATLALRETFYDSLNTKTVRCLYVCPPLETDSSVLVYCRNNCPEYSKCLGVNESQLFAVIAAARNGCFQSWLEERSFIDGYNNVTTQYCRDVCADSAVTTDGQLQYCENNCEGYRDCLKLVGKPRAEQSFNDMTTQSYDTVSPQLSGDDLSTVGSSLTTTPSSDESYADMTSMTLGLLIGLSLAVCFLIVIVAVFLCRRRKACGQTDAKLPIDCGKNNSSKSKLIELGHIEDVSSSGRTSAHSSSTTLSEVPGAPPAAKNGEQTAESSSEHSYRSPVEEEAETDLKKPFLARVRQPSDTRYSAECSETSAPTDCIQTAIQVEEDEGLLKGAILPTRSGNDLLCQLLR